MATAIILGAGSSQAACFPSTDDLTRQVLSGCGVSKSLGSSGFDVNLDEPQHPTDDRTLLVNFLVKLLHNTAKQYYKDYGECCRIPFINYEDLYFLAKQVHDDYTGEMENPAIHQFSRDLVQVVSQRIESRIHTEETHDFRLSLLGFLKGMTDQQKLLFLQKFFNDHSLDYSKFDELLDVGGSEDDKDSPEYRFQELCRDTLRYIVSIVQARLAGHNPSPESITYLDQLAAACESGGVTCIATLCHDTHLESFLCMKGIQISDGFSDPHGGHRNWAGWNGNQNEQSKLPYLKLHGSVNWISYASGYYEKVAIPLQDWDRMIGPDGGVNYADRDRPLMLIGTYNKITDYSSRVFLDIHFRFRQVVRHANRLVVCGYGFGDKRINEEIIDWVYRDPRRVIVIIHCDPAKLLENARGSIRNNISEWRTSKSVRFIKKTFQEATMDDYLD